ncbi:MAG: hypothetical protein E7020_01695 [Alphaproteobacteria bacterium]|nr:hypothetical protein [Alphaproteobacteria bacterium]
MDKTIPNRDIIDVTQDAVLNAASNVINVIETTAHELSVHNEPFYLTAEFWVAMAFVLALIVIANPFVSMFRKLTKERARAISKQISDAVNLKEEAQKLLADYERKYRGAEKEAADILAKSEKEIELIKKNALARLEAEIAIRERDAKARIKAAEDVATREVVDKVTDVTLDLVKKILSDSLDEKALDKLIDLSIDNLKRQV